MAAAGVPRNLADLILRCTAKKPEERIQSFGAIRHMLLGLLEEVRGGAPAVGGGAKPAPGVRMGPIVAVGLGALAVGVAGIWLLTGRKKVEPPPVPPPAMPAILDAKGGRMALIPAGPFLFGSSRSPVKLPAFYLDVTEVSNQAYREFATSVNHPLPNGFAADAPSLPVVNVTFTDAAAFCAWAGKRLPNEREWEKGARGGDGRNYPWGNDEVPGMANTNAKSLVAVNSFEAGASPYKLLHMTGNVLEWIDHPHTPSSAAVSSFATILQPAPTASEAWHYAKGGAYDRPLKDGVTYEWMSLPARMVRDSVGFRCAQDPPEAK
jgi:formylglycine-generating enzyme required for sulfatase activity